MKRSRPHPGLSNPNPDLGTLGEQFVAEWLLSQGWEILHQRWRCRWGELDLIAQKTQELAFIEVKTRSPRNWDEQGLLAIAPAKQAKLLKTAEVFLSQFPEFAEFPCHFDVALVSCHPSTQENRQPLNPSASVIQVASYELRLENYIVGAFDAD